MAIQDVLNNVLIKYKDLEEKLAKGHSELGDSYVSISKDYASLTDIVELINQLQSYYHEQDALNEMLNNQELELEYKNLAREEFYILNEQIEQLLHQIKLQLIPKDNDDEKNAIVEIRAGTGGDEAAIFCGDLFRMYKRYAENKKWKLEVLSASEVGVGGYKEIILNITGKGVFSRLKFESGVHRVQRVPETEAKGRVHTSAATVAVLPEVAEIECDINPKDLRIDIYRASGAGGQHVNTTESAVRLTHIPTGIVVIQQDERSQHKNKEKAMKVLLSRLYDHQKQLQDHERSSSRKTQIGSGDRSEKIRTYNFPQGRVSDHRINLTLYSLEYFMDGDLDEIVDALVTTDQAEKLSNLEL